MQISTRLEGGCGDCILATRLIQSVKDFYPDAEITAYIDSEGNELQKTVIDHIFPTFYKQTITIKSKKYKEFYIDSEWGTESLKGYIENCDPAIYEEMNKNYDLFLDYQIDSLKFLDYPYDWLKYFNKFPKIEIAPENKYGDYVCCQLISGTNFEHCLDRNFYVQRLIKDLDKYCQEKGLKLFLITTPEYIEFYQKILLETKVSDIFSSPITEVCDLIINCKGFLGTDSGFRFIANCMDLPVLTFTRNCYAPFKPFESHKIRWLVNENEVFPLNWNTTEVVGTFRKIMDNKIYRVFPYLQDYQKQLIKRNYKVNLEKSS